MKTNQIILTIMFSTAAFGLSACCNCADDSVEARKKYVVGFNSTSDCTLSSHGAEDRFLTFDCKEMTEEDSRIIFMAPCKMPLSSLKDHGFTRASVETKDGTLKCDPVECSCKTTD